MLERPYHVLFVCTANSARSILAEGLMNHMGAGRFKAWSAGSHPSGVVNPLALQALQKLGLPAEGFRSKSWEEFTGPEAPHLDFVFTVCDKAAGEMCPIWPGQPMTAHWGMANPAAVEGPPEKKAQAFTAAAALLKRRIELLLALPTQRLDAIALQREIRAIGQQ